MKIGGPEIPLITFERLQRLIAAAIVPCSNAQICDLADQLHGAIRRRRDDEVVFSDPILAEARVG